MKHSLSIGRVGLLALPASILLASAPAVGQSRYYWSTKYDGGSGLEDNAKDLVISPQGRIFLAGSSANSSNSDALVQAYDPYGNLAWQNRIDFGGEESANMLAFDGLTGDLYVVGTSSTGGFTHWLILRMSAQTGAIVWQHDYFGPQPTFGLPMSMALPGGGGVVVGGFFGALSSRAFVARFDAAGALAWEWIHTEPGATLLNCQQLAADPGGDIAVRVTANIAGSSWKIHRLSGAGALRWSTAIGNGNFGADGPKFDSASNVVFAVNGLSPVIGSLDVAGNLLWSVPTSAFLPGSSSISIAIAPGDDVVALGLIGELARLDPAGNLLWAHGPPPLAWFEQSGIASGLAVAPNGDAIMRLSANSTVAYDHFDAVLRWDAGGNFLWSQSVRNFEPNVDVQTSGLALAPQGSVLIAGSCRAGAAPHDIFMAGVRESSRLGCFGDGSSGPCPCGNTTSSGIVSGCLHDNSHYGARLDDQGIASLGSDSLRFGADHLTSGGIAILLQGLPTAVPINFQDGRLCMQGPLLRIGAAGFSGSSVDVAPPSGQRVHERSAALGDPIQPGTSRTYQLFYRGGLSVCLQGNGNLTNSVVVDWTP